MSICCVFCCHRKHEYSAHSVWDCSYATKLWQMTRYLCELTFPISGKIPTHAFPNVRFNSDANNQHMTQTVQLLTDTHSYGALPWSYGHPANLGPFAHLDGLQCNGLQNVNTFRFLYGRNLWKEHERSAHVRSAYERNMWGHTLMNWKIISSHLTIENLLKFYPAPSTHFIQLLLLSLSSCKNCDYQATDS